jgi:hypothetical protein
MPLVVRRASLAAARAHRRLRPHDVDGAEMAGDLEAGDAAIEHLSTAYMDTLDWAVGVLDERREAIESGRGRIRWWRRLSPPHAVAGPVQCEVPQPVLEGLTRRATEPGWGDRRAA